MNIMTWHMSGDIIFFGQRYWDRVVS